MYLKIFDGKRNGATVQRGYSLVQLLVVMLLVSILAAAFTAYRESVRSANLRAAHAALLENARFMEQFYAKKGSFKLTSTKWPELPVKEAGGFCINQLFTLQTMLSLLGVICLQPYLSLSLPMTTRAV